MGCFGDTPKKQKKRTRCECGKGRKCRHTEQERRLADALDIALDTASLTLTAINSVGGAVPGLSQGAGAALVIVTIFQNMRNVDAGMRVLVRSVCKLMTVVYDFVEGSNARGTPVQFDSPMSEAIRDLQRDLILVKDLVEVEIRRSWIARFFSATGDADKITEYQRSFDQSWNFFATKLTMEMAHKVAMLFDFQVANARGRRGSSQYDDDDDESDSGSGGSGTKVEAPLTPVISSPKKVKRNREGRRSDPPSQLHSGTRGVVQQQDQWGERPSDTPTAPSPREERVRLYRETRGAEGVQPPPSTAALPGPHEHVHAQIAQNQGQGQSVRQPQLLQDPFFQNPLPSPPTHTGGYGPQFYQAAQTIHMGGAPTNANFAPVTGSMVQNSGTYYAAGRG